MGLSVPKYEKDVVYLIQFPRTRWIPDISPYCLKAETWLRMCDITYRNHIDVLKGSQEAGLKPFVEINGREIGDSVKIINELTKKFHVDLDAHLTQETRSTALVYERLIEDSFFWYTVYVRSHKIAFKELIFSKQGMLEGFPKAIQLFAPIVRGRLHSGLKKRAMAHGVGKVPKEITLQRTKDSLKAFDFFVRDKAFLGGAKPSQYDATVFSHLAQIYFVPLTTADPIRDFMRSDLSNLCRYMENIKSTWWKDWGHIIRHLATDTYGKSETS